MPDCSVFVLEECGDDCGRECEECCVRI